MPAASAAALPLLVLALATALALPLTARAASAGFTRWNREGRRWKGVKKDEHGWRWANWRHTFEADWTPGKETLPGQGIYASECDCVAQRSSLVTGAFRNSMCTLPRNFELVPARNEHKGEKGAFFAASLVAKIVGRPDDMRLVQVRHASFSCVDGRDPLDDRALRTPGGDMAEFIYMIEAWDRTVRTVYEALVDKLLYSWIRYGGRKAFTMETDVAAVEGIARKLQADGTFFKDDILDLTVPPADLQKVLLEELQRGSNQGNLHLRMMIKHPKEYGIKAVHAQLAIKAFFKLLWNKDLEVFETFNVGTRVVPRKFELHRRLKLVVREGKRREGAWVNVRNIAGCEVEEVASLFPPHHDFHQRQYLVDGALVQRAVKRGDEAGGESSESSADESSAADDSSASGSMSSGDGKDDPGAADDPAADATLPRPRHLLVFHRSAVNTLRAQLGEFMKERDVLVKSARAASKEIQKIARRAVSITRLFSIEKLPEFTLRVL